MFNIFGETVPIKSLLPSDGEVKYYAHILNLDEANRYFNLLKDNILWQNDIVKIYGKTIVTARKTAWYSTKSRTYKYSGIERKPLDYTKELIEIQAIIEQLTGEKFNSCLLNLYHSGDEGMGWHSDNEPEIVKYSAIASVSLGIGRSFSFKHKQSKETLKLFLENGSLLIMKGLTQEKWLHSLPKTTKISEPRINLTFRLMAE